RSSRAGAQGGRARPEPAARGRLGPAGGGVSASDSERLARLALARVAEPGARAVHAALQNAPAEEGGGAVRNGAPLDQLGQRALEGMRSRAETCDPRRDLERLADVGGRVVCPGDDEWPEGLDWHPDVMGGEVKELAPPWVLLARGAQLLRPALELSVAVV